MKRRLKEQFSRHITAIKFFVVGGWNTAFGYFAFYFFESVLSGVKLFGAYSYLPAIVLSNVVSLLMAYSLHRAITFRSTTAGKAVIWEFFRFVIGNMATVGLSLALLPLFVEVFGVRPKLAGFFVMLIAAFANYIAHSRITFRNQTLQG